MPKAVRFENVEVLAGGGTTTVLSTSMTEKIVLFTSGSIVMAAPFSLTHDGSWAEGSELDVLWSGDADITGGAITLFGYVLTQAQASAGNLKGTAYAKSGTVVFTPEITAGTAQIGTADIAPLAVTTAKIDNLAVTSGKLAAGAVIAGKITAGTIVNTDVNAAAAVAYTKLNLANSIVNNDIKTTAGIQVSKLEAMTNGQIITGNTASGNIATIVPMSSDVAIANTGATTIQAASVTPEKATTNLNTQSENIYIDLAVDTGKYSWKMGDNFQLISVSGINNAAIVANCSIALDIGGVPVTGGTVSWTAADPINTQKSGTAITAANTGASGATINFTLTTAGGESAIINLSLVYRKTS